MFENLSYIFTFSGLSLLLHVANTSGNLTVYGNSAFYKTCINTATFKHIFHTTLPKCSDECFRRQRCALTMFHQSLSFCALKESMDIKALEEVEPLCLYNSFDHKLEDRFNKHPCFNNTCALNERCTEKTGGKYDCVKSECPASKKIDNAALLSNTHDIGTTNRYKCNAGYVGIGTSTITCDNRAAWTSTDFICIRRCPQPRKSYFNADLTAVYGDGFYEGTVLHFTCRNGYNRLWETANSTCSSGRWDPYKVACCHDNSSVLWGDECIKIIDVGIAKTFDEATAHCEDIEGHLRYVDLDILDSLAERTEITWVLQNSPKSWFDSIWNYTACAVANGEADDQSLSFDEKVHSVKENGWEGYECNLVSSWGPDEPNGKQAENCVLYKRELKLYFDFSCDELPTNVSFVCRFDLPFV